MESFASPMRIPVVRATALHYWLVACHVVMFVALIRFCPPGLHTALLALLVIVSLVLEIFAIGMPDRRCKVLLLGRHDEWSLVKANGERCGARLLAGYFVSTRLVIMRLQAPGARPLHVVLTPANTPPDVLRRLRVRLRFPLSADLEGSSGYA
jgi:hypothetical protein